MPHRILIRYRGSDQPLDWLSEDERGRALGGPASGRAPAAADLTGAREIVVLVPAEDILLLEAQVAARSRAQLMRAIPFALEDQLAEPVESLHFAAVAHPSGSGQLVAAVRRERLRGWLSDLESRGIRPDRVLPDALLLQQEPGAVAALVEGNRVLVRCGPARAFVASVGDVAEWLQLSDAPRDADGRIRVIAAGEPSLALDGTRFSLERTPSGSHPMIVFAAALRVRVAVPDLLSGDFAPQHRGEPVRRLWRWAAMAAGAAVLLGFGWAALDRQLRLQQVQALRAEMLKVYAQVYPGGAAPQNFVDRMRADYGAQGGSRADGGALDVLARAAPLLAAQTQVALKAAEYRGDALELVVLAPAVSTLDQLREALAATQGLNAELVGANTGERGTEGRIRVTRRPT